MEKAVHWVPEEYAQDHKTQFSLEMFPNPKYIFVIYPYLYNTLNLNGTKH